jgi:hypothetical protein
MEIGIGLTELVNEHGTVPDWHSFTRAASGFLGSTFLTATLMVLVNTL